jgi:dihydroxyacetone kinase-like protein
MHEPTGPAAVVDVAALDAWVRGFAAAVAEHRDELTRLDSAIGDADHGSNLDRGLTAVVGALDEAAPLPGPGALLKQVGMTLVSKVGGASGPLYGTFFLRMATAAGARESLDAHALAVCLRAGLDGVVARGRAEVGDKTMVDALVPFSRELTGAVEGGASLREAWKRAADAATRAAAATADLLPRMGRARPHAEKSLGTPDPGAHSLALIMTAVGSLLADEERN